MKKLLVFLTLTGLLMFPFNVLSADGALPSQNMQYPPVAQELVREGDFALQLAASLNLGSPADEASAEAVLTQAGIAPLNGWLSDYPVTPQIVGQLEDSIRKTTGEGKLGMSSDEALGRLYSLSAEARLPIPAASGSALTGDRQAPAAMPSNPTVINNYYYDQGPPIVTYYPPPMDYVYLYDWVPYPAWWFGFWFPGFYISHSFTTVVVTGPFIGDDGRRHIVTNQMIDPVTRTRIVVSPVVTTRDGRVSPVTTIRTGNGDRFRTLSELRQRAGAAGRSGVGVGSVNSRDSRQVEPQPLSGRSQDNTVIRGEGGGRYYAPRMPATPYIAPGTRGGRRSPDRLPSDARQERSGDSRLFRWQGTSDGWNNAPDTFSRPFDTPGTRGGDSRRTPSGNSWQGRDSREER